MWEIQIKIHFQKLRKNFEYKILKWKEMWEIYIQIPL